ncbi:hypothetical protein EUA93_10140 [Nocardioides oleivorans]|uniref:Glycosyl hydrolase family 67 C-terminal domain-containing protein n=1 Tax=Nocardioides oleivorans TaxID=273676 RepID=A0A4Q2RZE6_9ACTN|nr:hypothetical protein [Nocardioides oleivorans]RYB94671.1 hypothetical protein EUA93_10140 [Nocardioides oleivorans]
MRARRGLQVGVVLLVLVALGAGIAFGISSALGIRVEPKQVPVEELVAAPPREAVAPPRLTDVAAPDGVRMDAALAELDDATAGETEGTATLRVTYDDGVPAADRQGDDSYRLTGAPERLRIAAGSETGAVRGVYDLAAAARAGRPLTEHLGETVTSELPFRMVDLGAAGVDPDPEQWRGGTDYSHYSRAFEDVFLDDAPYIDQAALAEARESVLAYAHHVLAQGYNAVAVPGFLDHVTFDAIPEVYADDPAYAARAAAMRDAFGPIYAELDDLGLDVYLRTDMLILSEPLERYLTDRFDLDTEDPGLWQVYEAALDEIYTQLPQLSGVVLRIGEGGGIYNSPGIDYYSEISVTTPKAVRAMLGAFTEQAERADKDVVFRTWSVGVGAVGDMHTDPESYDEVLAGIDSPRLVVSTKYSLGDFYSWLPLNETLDHGDQRRIVELQSRREFEAFGAVPDDLGVLHQMALQRFIAANPHVEGIWTWTQDGGPWRAGPRSLLLTTGFWQLYDLNSETAARLARDPDADPAGLTADWVRRWFSTDPDTVAAITQAMSYSREAVTHGQYVPQFAEVRAFALGLEPPPQMLLFEWDILTGDSAVLDVLYAIARDHGGTDGLDGVTAAIDDGQHAVDLATTMRDLVDRTDPATYDDPAMREQLLAALDYQVDLYALLGAYREMTLRHALWLDTGEGRGVWETARARFDAAATEHEATYGGDLALPAYNLTAARIGEARAARDLPMAWLARGGLALLVLVLGLTRTGRALVRTAATPWREPGSITRWLVVAIPLVAVVWSRLVLTWFLAPSHLLLVGIGWTVLALVVVAACRWTRSWHVAVAVGGAVTIRSVVLLAVLAWRGPGGYWFAFWTEPGTRSAYVVVAFVLAGWVLAALLWSLAAHVGRRRATAAVLHTVALTLLGVGSLLQLVGLEDALTVWNDQLALLPWGMARILGITTFLGIPTTLPTYALAAGGVLLLAAAASGLSRRPARPADG